MFRKGSLVTYPETYISSLNCPQNFKYGLLGSYSTTTSNLIHFCTIVTMSYHIQNHRVFEL